MSDDEGTAAAAAAQQDGSKQQQTRHPAVDFAVAGSATSCACVLSNPVSEAACPSLWHILHPSLPSCCAPRAFALFASALQALPDEFWFL